MAHTTSSYFLKGSTEWDIWCLVSSLMKVNLTRSLSCSCSINVREMTRDKMNQLGTTEPLAPDSNPQTATNYIDSEQVLELSCFVLFFVLRQGLTM